MTKLLVSVRNGAEAEAAVAGGADLIDVKEPQHGSLGAATAEAIQHVFRAVAGKAPVSAALGELTELIAGESIGHRTLDSWIAGAAAPCLTKIGLSNCVVDGRDLLPWRDHWREHVDRIAGRSQSVAVVYADFAAARAPHPIEVLRCARELRCAAVLVDTFNKDGRSLLDHWTREQLGEFAAQVRSAKQLFVAGGSLTVQLLPEVLRAAPDYIAVRGAACTGSRTSEICAERVRMLRSAMDTLV